jgi:hypothetical protein
VHGVGIKGIVETTFAREDDAVFAEHFDSAIGSQAGQLDHRSSWLVLHRDHEQIGSTAVLLARGGDRYFGIPSTTDMRSYAFTTLRLSPNPDSHPGYTNGNNCNTALTSPHPGGVQMVLGDGSVRFISDTIDLQTFYNLGNKDDGNSIGEY